MKNLEKCEKEIDTWLKSSVPYVNTLFEKARLKRIEYAKVSVPFVDKDFNLMCKVDKDKLELEADEAEKIAWNEYYRLAKELGL